MRLFPVTPPPTAGATARRAVFIDKDGTLVEDVPYNVDPALLRFTQGGAEGLRRLQARGFLLIVISNQPGVALGRFGLPALQRLAEALAARLAAEGVRLDGFHACPHAPVPPSPFALSPSKDAAPTAAREACGDDPASGASDAGAAPAQAPATGTPTSPPRPCRCRKPAPGLLLEAARLHRIDLGGSWMVGDILDDVEAGWRAGCRSIHLDVGNETVWRHSPIRVPTHTAPDLLAAAEAILASAAAGRPARGGTAAPANALPAA